MQLLSRLVACVVSLAESSCFVTFFDKRASKFDGQSQFDL